MQAIPLLDPAECARVRTLVHALRPQWIQRAPLPFFTLGAATYIDAVGGRRADYLALAARLNPVLARHFGWLHDRVVRALESRLGQGVSCAPGLALPGFHIFLAHQAFTQPLASVHLDLQYREHPWADLGDPDLDHPVSFTLAIALPAAGSGLFVWPRRTGDFGEMSGEETQDFLRRHPPEHVPYAVGSMVVHDGHLPHQIAPPPALVPGDERITLQGHALRCGDRWYAYW